MRDLLKILSPIDPAGAQRLSRFASDPIQRGEPRSHSSARSTPERLDSLAQCGRHCRALHVRAGFPSGSGYNPLWRLDAAVPDLVPSSPVVGGGIFASEASVQADVRLVVTRL